jgi:tRNA-dihydrouridine synthase 1
MTPPPPEEAAIPGPGGGGKLHGWEFWRSIGSPKLVAAPMVDQSELPFRMLCRRYGTQLAYTPMLHSRLFRDSAKYRQEHFTTCPEDRPLFAQFCGDDPETLLAAAQQLPAGACDAVDLNFGCPQGIARKGHYGAFLLSERDLLESIVRRLDTSLAVPVTVKMRLVNKQDLQDTINLASALEAAGASVVCLHGRTKEEKGQHQKGCDWDAIAAVRRRIGVPMIANGGVRTYDDATRCLEVTGCDAVMSSEALLENPGLFAPSSCSRDSGRRSLLLQEDLASEYLDLAKAHGCQSKCVKAHMFHFLYAALQLHTDLRSQLGQAKGIDEMAAVNDALRRRRAEDRSSGVKWPETGWYMRYREPLRCPEEKERKKRKAQEAEAEAVRDGPSTDVVDEQASKRQAVETSCTAVDVAVAGGALREG